MFRYAAGVSAFRRIEFSDPRHEVEGLRHVTVCSEALRGRGDLTVWSPPGLPGALPLVILLHGVYASHWAWAFKGGAHRTAARLIREGDLPPVALAMPSDGLRADGTGYLGQLQADYETWAIDEVPRAAAEALGTRHADAPVFLCGLSMGGFGAMRLGARHGAKVRGISAHSSATALHQLERFLGGPITAAGTAIPDPTVLAAMLRHRQALPPLRFDCGVDDFLIEPNRELHRALTEAGIRHIYAEFPGAHDWPYWEKHLADSLRFFGKLLRAG